MIKTFLQVVQKALFIQKFLWHLGIKINGPKVNHCLLKGYRFEEQNTVSEIIK